MEKPGIVLLMGPGRSGTFLYNYLKNYFTINAVIIEKPVSKTFLLKRRVKKLGWFTVFGQIVFQLLIPPLLKRTSRNRIRELMLQFGLNETPIDEETIIRVLSVNDISTIEILKKLNPSVVVINGTRIISKKMLEEVNSYFLNTHAGITPKYRGVHGGYWAMANNKKDECGVTIHFVDKGIDTGNIISQHLIHPSGKDNFITYPLIQLGTALPEMVKVIYKLVNGTVSTLQNKLESRLWHHPTIWIYLYNRIFKGVK